MNSGGEEKGKMLRSLEEERWKGTNGVGVGVEGYEERVNMRA